MRAMQHIVGFEDLKPIIAEAIAFRKHTHFLLEGPPASVKSTILDAIRNIVPDSTMVFGRGTSAKGLSNKLFEEQPSVLLMDELDKSKKEVREMILGLMETGEILNTKADDSRGIVLDTLVSQPATRRACSHRNSKSRFAMHLVSTAIPGESSLRSSFLCFRKAAHAPLNWLSTSLFRYSITSLETCGRRGISGSL